MMKTAVLVSGGGTNLQAIIDAIRDGRITDTEISLVLSNNKHAYALERASKAGIPALSISPKDFSFIVEENMSNIFGLFAKYKVKVNVMQNSAIDFSASIDANNRNFDALVADLQKEYFVKYNENLQLITIRYYTDEAINRMISGHKVYMTQKSRKTARFVIE